MKFTETPLRGAYIIEPEPITDERGYFVRSFCEREFEAHGIKMDIKQTSVSFNARKGTLRGMHYQAPPHEEAKLVTCIRGRMYDVIIDLREGSETFRKWFAVELDEAYFKSIYIPEGFAHGFQTLAGNTVVCYQMSEFYHPESAMGIRWNDPAYAIEWPENVNLILSEKDRNLS